MSSSISGNSFLAPGGEGAQPCPTDRASLIAECLEWLRLFIEPQQVTQLIAFDVRESGLHKPIQKNGYYDGEHLAEMAEAAIGLSGNCRGVHFTFNPLAPEVLTRCRNRVEATGRGAAASDRDVARRRWLLVDVDATRVKGISATDEEKENARAVAFEIRDFLRFHSFRDPIIADSGNGFHLYYAVDLRTDDQRPKQFLNYLADRFGNEGASIDMSVSSASQLTRLYGTSSCKGDPTDDRPHRRSRVLEVPEVLCTVSGEQLERVVGPVERRQTAPATSPVIQATPATSDRQSAEVLERARAYLLSMSASIAGQRGDDQLFQAACSLVRGFDIPVDQALPLLREYNQRAEPPWDESRLRYKLEQANGAEEDRERGYLLRGRGVQLREEQSLRPLPGPVFPGSVPDFVLAGKNQSLYPMASQQIRPGRGRKRRWGSCCRWLLFMGLHNKRQYPVIVSDETIKACVWGANRPPRDWRQQLREVFGSSLEDWGHLVREHDEKKDFLERVPQQTTWHSGSIYWADKARSLLGETEELRKILDSRLAIYSDATIERRTQSCLSCSPGATHHHFPLVDSKAIKGIERLFWEETPALYYLDEALKNDHGELICDEIKQELYHCYLPIQLFGDSPRVNIPQRQTRLFQGIMREITRKLRRGTHAGADRVEWISRGRVKGIRGKGTIICPFLERNARYVNFGGNMKQHRGRSYQLIGRNRTGWLHRAGYPVDGETPDDQLWEWVRFLFEDLDALAERFSLIACGLGHDGMSWKPLGELKQLVRTPRGRTWLNSCRLRIFAPDDYLTRWRHWFAERLGFSYIPGGAWEMPEHVERHHRFATPEAVRAWLRDNGITQKRLARELGVSPSLVSGYLSGKKRWSAQFAGKCDSSRLVDSRGIVKNAIAQDWWTPEESSRILPGDQHHARQTQASTTLLQQGIQARRGQPRRQARLLVQGRRPGRWRLDEKLA